ncbi:MAG TPA: FAD-binding protein [Candidatus Thermoplasmatota archaeon]|nr:FAD-binding protein [Candidatus Thermoplasmatota archaeon]
MSPFTNELPKGQARKLEYYFGDRASDDIAERVLYSRDAAVPPATLNLLLKRDAWAVVRPQVRGELLELLQFAKQNGVPIVPRGGGTSGYGGSVPTEGGVVVDMRGFNKVLEVSKEGLWVRCEGNVTFHHLEEALRPHGLTLRQYPTSMHAATVAGWLAQGGGGVGSAKYGPFRNDIVRVKIISPDGRELTAEADDLDLVSETFGAAGFIVEVTLKVRPATKHAHFLASFDSLENAQAAARRALLEARPYNVSVFTQEYAELVNKAANARLLPNKAGILVTLESADAPQQVEIVKGVVLTGGGTMAKEADAQKAWDNRFNHLNLKRLGPSVVVAESIIHAEKLVEGMAAAAGASRIERSCLWAIAVSPSEFDIIYYGLDDERRATYPLAMGNALAVIDAVKAVGGRSYSTGVLASGESKAVLGKERLKVLKQWRKKTDKKEIFNPGVVTGPRTRLMPLPVHDFPLQMKLAGPMLKMQRGILAHSPDPQFAAMQRALGRVHAGDLGSLATEVTTCIFCGMCNAAAPEARTQPWESAQPRGRVQLAKAVIEGRATLSPRVHRNVAWTALEHGPDAICPTAIPIQRVTDLLLAACVQQFGPLPEQAGLAEQYAGKERSKWVNVGFDPVSTTMFLADDVAAFEANEVAQSAAVALMNAGYPVGHMGKDDGPSGAALFETGQRKAADALVAPFLEKLAKRGARAIVTPDANAARAIALDWPLVGKANEVAVPEALHTTTVLADLLKAKKLEVDGEKKLAKKVVFHAPEGLSTAQRAAALEVAKAVSGTLVDCEHHECGHGRALKLLDDSLAQRLAEGCIKGAMAAGAEIILTASPGCYQTLRSAAKKAKAGVEIVDVHVALAQSMKSSGGAVAMVAPTASAEPQKPVEPEIPPDHFRVEFVKEGVVVAVHKNQNILAAGADAGLDLPSSCKAGSCDTCSARYEGSPPDQTAGSALNADQQKTYVLTCIARPRGPVKIWSDERPK